MHPPPSIPPAYGPALDVSPVNDSDSDTDTGTVNFPAKVFSFCDLFLMVLTFIRLNCPRCERVDLRVLHAN